ncbi:MAG: DNA repair protein RecN, partial [Myxococcota bacterium]
ARLVVELERAEGAAFDIALELSRKRRSAAERMRGALEAELEDLNMARTSFVVHFETDDAPEASLRAYEERGWSLTEKGFDQIEFLISPNMGEEPKPLSKIASGGELSRIMLVMKSALAERDHVETYVFDEVDTGIGGSTADMVGWKIARTGKDRQVLCITHLPQIASLSDHHYLVEKQLLDGRTQSTIVPLKEAQRVEEIARMLGGTRVTTTTLEAAREMIHRPLIEGVR